MGVPGTVHGLEWALKQYGTMKRAALIAPAIRHAEQGFVLDQGDVDMLRAATADFAKDPAIAASSQGGKGIITQADLDQHHTREMKPVECGYRGYRGYRGHHSPPAQPSNGRLKGLPSADNHPLRQVHTEAAPGMCPKHGETVLGTTFCPSRATAASASLRRRPQPAPEFWFMPTLQWVAPNHQERVLRRRWSRHRANNRGTFGG